jgi:hypothetical protein
MMSSTTDRVYGVGDMDIDEENEIGSMSLVLVTR